MEHNEKVCCAQELDSYAQGQGHNQVRGHIVPKIVLLINYLSKKEGYMSIWPGVMVPDRGDNCKFLVFAQ